MRNLILGAALALFLIACGAAAHDYASRQEVDYLSSRVSYLEAIVVLNGLQLPPPVADLGLPLYMESPK